MSFHVRCLTFLLPMLLLGGCKKPVEQPDSANVHQSITFKLALNSQLLTCADVQGGVLLQGKQWKIDALKFYLHQLTFIKGDEKRVVDFVASDWQTNLVALLSLEPDLCTTTEGSAKGDANQTLYFKRVPVADSADKMSLTIGVPFEENHKNPLTQPSPLNLPFMFWSWQLGHKFIRWDMTSSTANWSFHLGSLGCDSASSVRAPIQPCAEPNTVSVELRQPNTSANEIWVHLDRIVEGLDLNEGSSCVLHGATESSCATLLQNLQYNEVFEWR